MLTEETTVGNLNCNYVKVRHSKCRAVLAQCFIISCFMPAPACTTAGTAEEREINLSRTGLEVKAPGNARCLDIFYFNDDTLGRLDSYQRIEGTSLTHATGASRVGNKILVVLANASVDKFTWGQINSYRQLKRQASLLRDEQEGEPVMSAVERVTAGKETRKTMTLEPILARITLGSISCDFHQRPYPDAKLTDVKAYLINVSARCPFLSDSAYRPDTYINVGRLVENDMEGFAWPEIVSCRIADSVGTELVKAEKDFYCYPNACEEGLGTPSTRLVIEGRLMGKTYYYPIDVGKEDGDGIHRNTAFRYDVTITRRGSLDPDTPAETGAVQVRMAMEPWKEKNVAVIDF
jgi:hypothetical protein